MKVAIAIATIALFGCCCLVAADPIQISNNNVGDIITAGFNAEISIESNVNVSVINVILAILVHFGELDLSQLPPLPRPPRPDEPEPWSQLPALNAEEQQLFDAVVWKLKNGKH